MIFCLIRIIILEIFLEQSSLPQTLAPPKPQRVSVDVQSLIFPQLGRCVDVFLLCDETYLEGCSITFVRFTKHALCSSAVTRAFRLPVGQHLTKSVICVRRIYPRYRHLSKVRLRLDLIISSETRSVPGAFRFFSFIIIYKIPKY